ncbi:hypothetical protein OROHE_018099 [Orobanche hederae]
MAANGGRRPPPPPPFMIKKEGGFDDENHNNIIDDDDHEAEHRVGNISSDMKGISIAERRAAKCGFNSARINNAPTGLPSPQHGLQSSPYVTIPPGISPSALLDSPIMVPNSQPFVDSCYGYRMDYGHETDYRCSILEPPVNTSSNGTFREVGKHSEDGFYWRKYGQKHVKGSEFPRSYYKCTNADCLVKKKVERSHAGEITQIVYKGSHNHLIPQPRLNGMPDNDQMAAGITTSFLGDFSHDRHVSVGALCDHKRIDEAREFSVSNSISNNHDSRDGVDDHNHASPGESVSFRDEEEENNGESCCELKKRKRENFPNETTLPRPARESKVVVQIESDVDVLDDGYRWRKYGQKVVKGNPNPRSYYKCTTPGCPVRKHVERAADDIKSVLTTYEAKHNHDVPTSKTGASTMPDHVANHLPPAVAKVRKQVRDLLVPLYMERKPILNYNDLMRSNLPGNFSGHDLGGFGAPPPSSLYPYSFPPFPSIAYNPLLMNGNNNHVNSYSPSSKFYPMWPLDNYMSTLPSPIGHFPFSNNYVTLRQDQIPECQTPNIIMKPKEERTGDGS